MTDSLAYNVAPLCHPTAQVTFDLPIEVDDDSGRTTYPLGDEPLIAACPVCGAKYAAMNKGPEMRVRPLDEGDPDSTRRLLEEDLG